MTAVRENLIEECLLDMWRSSVSHMRLVDHLLLAEQFIVGGKQLDGGQTPSMNPTLMIASALYRYRRTL